MNASINTIKPAIEMACNRDTLTHAKDLIKAGNFKQAVKILFPILQENQRNVIVLYRLGICYYKLEKYENALKCLKRAAKLGYKHAAKYLPIIEEKIASHQKLDTPAEAVINNHPPQNTHQPLNIPETVSKDQSMTDSTVEIFPWENSPELVAKAEAYEEQGNLQRFSCKCNEFLNCMIKKQAASQIVEKGMLNIYPDVVSVTEQPGWLDHFLSKLPPVIANVIRFVLGWVCFWVPMVFSLATEVFCFLGSNINNPITAMFAAGIIISIGITVIVMAPILIPAAIVAGIAWRFVCNLYYQRKYASVAQKIRQDPKSPYAIKKLFKYSENTPRYWEKGDLVQILRIDTQVKLFGKHYIFLVQDAPFPEKMGVNSKERGMFLQFRLAAKRRVYAISIKDGKDHADQAAQAVAETLGLSVTTAQFKRGRLILN